MNGDASALKAIAGSALVLVWSVPFAVASLMAVLALGKAGYLIALGAVPVVATLGASLTSPRVARVAWRLALVGPVVMLATLGGLVLAGGSLFSVDTAYWGPPSVSLIVLFAINCLVLASSKAKASEPARAKGKVQ